MDWSNLVHLHSYICILRKILHTVWKVVESCEEYPHCLKTKHIHLQCGILFSIFDLIIESSIYIGYNGNWWMRRNMELKVCKLFQYICCSVTIFGLLFRVQTALREFDFLPDSRFDNYLLNHGLLWELPSASTLMCAVRCAKFKTCISFYFNQDKKCCRGYETLILTTEAGGYEGNWNYFYLTQIGR